MTSSSNTLKLKYSSNGMINSNEFIEESMKCIPEIGEKQIDIIQKQLGCSQYGQIMLARLHNESHQLSMNSSRNGYANDLSPETDAKNRETGKNNDDKDNGNETLVLLKTLENDKLSDFLHEMKSKWFISAKSERIAKLIGFLSSPSSHLTAMIVECGEYDLAHFLRNCDKKSIGYVLLKKKRKTICFRKHCCSIPNDKQQMMMMMMTTKQLHCNNATR